MTNKAKGLRICLIFLIVTFGVAFFVSVQAQTPDNNQATAKQAVTVATVNIYDLKIVSQNKNDFKLSFDLSNRENIQPDVQYAIQLIKEDKTQSIADQKVYDETLNLGENQTISKQIDYAAPIYLKGSYSLMLVAKNAAGMALALGKTEKVVLNGDGKFVEIIPSSCFITIEGDTTNKKYTLDEGVDIASSEKLIGTCTVQNHLISAVNLQAKFETYYRTLFGELIATEKGDQFSLALGEKKVVNFPLPKTANPQAYDIKTTLLNDQGSSISNSVVFHYVVQGVSATIQNIRLDKDYYAKGDTAAVSFVWSGAADSFLDSRNGGTKTGDVTVAINIKDYAGQMCTNGFKSTVSADSPVNNLQVPITADCVNPQVSVSVADVKGSVLDDRNYNIQSSNIPAAKTTATVQKESPKQSFNMQYLPVLIVGVIALLALLVALYIHIKNKRKNNLYSIIFFLLIGGLALFSSHNAKADTFYYGSASYTVNLNKTVYAPGENVTVTASYSQNYCSNTPRTGSMKWGFDGFYYEEVTIGNVSGTINVTLPAPTNGEDHLASFDFGLNYGYGVYGSLPFKLAYDGVCGSYNNQSASVPSPPLTIRKFNAILRCPTNNLSSTDRRLCSSLCQPPVTAVYDICDPVAANLVNPALCAIGTPSAVTDTDPQIWTCSGTTGRTNASCSTLSLTPVCTGADPTNSTLCSGDDAGLAINTSKTLVASCTAGTKCEYVCNSGFHLNGGACVADCAQECTDTPTACSASCGGGTQTCTWRNADCTTTPNIPLTCNSDPCPENRDLNWREVTPN